MSTHTLIPHTTPTTYATAGGGVTLSVSFEVRKSCDVAAVWFFAPVGAQSLTASVYSYTGAGTSSGQGTLISGTTATANGATLGWTNNTWVRVPLTAPVTLAPGQYRACITTTGGGTYPYTNGFYATDPGAGNSNSSPQTNAFSKPNSFNGPVYLLTPKQAFSNNGSTPAFPASQAPAMASFWVDVEVNYTNPSHTYDGTGVAAVYNMDSYANRAAMLAAGWDFLAPVDGGVYDTETGNVTYAPVTVPQTVASTDWICRDLPSDWVSVQVTMGHNEGTAAKGGYGVGIFQDRSNNAFAFAPRGGAAATYFPRVMDGMANGTALPATDINIPGFNGTHLRLDRDPYTNLVMAQWSNDGSEWRYIRSFTHSLTNPRLVLANYGGDGTQSVVWHSVTVKTLSQTATLHGEMNLQHVNLKVGVDDILIGYQGTTKMVTTNYTGSSVKFTFLGDVFDPKIELHAGSTATVSWADVDGNILAVGPTPTINLGYAAQRTIQMFVRSSGANAFNQVKTINLGYANDDAGLYMADIATYARPAMLVSGITSLNLCTALVNFLAGRTPLAGAVDFSGMSALEQINCFNARIDSVNLTGCTALVRLCLEACAVSSIDLNPVSASLKDLRIATQYASSTGAILGLTFTSITGNMAALYHYCVRDQPITNHIPNSKLPVVMQRWDWNTGASTMGAPTSSVLTSVISFSNTYSQATVDSILSALVSLGATSAQIPAGGDWTLNCDLTGSAAPSSAGLASATTLTGRGWTVSHS